MKTVRLLRIFIAAPSDVEAERNALQDIISEFNLTSGRFSSIRLELVRWETHSRPGFGADAQAVINEQIGDDYDIFVGVLWARVGTATSRAISGTLEEFDEALKRHQANPGQISLMMYFKQSLLPPGGIDTAQLSQVQAFQKRVSNSGGLYATFEDTSDFTRQIRMHLAAEVQHWQSRSRTDPTPSNGDMRTAEAVVVPDPPPNIVEEYGIVDYLEVIDESSRQLREVIDRINNATTTIAEESEKRAEEMKTLAATGTALADIKRVNNEAARNMEAYASTMEGEIPIFGVKIDLLLTALSKLAIMLVEHDPSSLPQVEDALGHLRELRRAAEQARLSQWSFRNSVAALPRMTVQLNQARRRVVSILDKQDDAFASALRLIDTTEERFRELMD